MIAQDRLGPGRIHHCMRAIGTAERAIEMMCDRANTREAFGGPLAEKQFVQDFIATLADGDRPGPAARPCYAAWKMDTEGKRRARQEISMIKVVAANVVMDVLDRAIQVHGALGMSDDTPLAGDVALPPHAQGRRRARRGPQDGDRPPRARTAPRSESDAPRRATARRLRARSRAQLAQAAGGLIGLRQPTDGLVGRLGQALDDLRELLEALVGLAVLAGGVAGVDALEDDRQLPVAERDEEVDLGEVAAGALGVALPDLARGREARARSSPARTAA